MKKRLACLLVCVLFAAGCSGGGGGASSPAASPAAEPAASSASGSVEASSASGVSGALDGASSGTGESAADKQRLTKRKVPASPADMIEAISYEHKKNPDTVGWLAVPGTDISNSVVQSNNNAYYLHLTERKESDVFGSYFADYESSIGPRDTMTPNIVIYGHSDLKDNQDGLRFSQLLRFADETFARATPSLNFSTITEYMTWQVFAVFYTESSMQYNKARLDGAQMAALVAEAKAKSLYNYDVPVADGDKIVTLSTCTVKYGDRRDQRFVVMAKLLPAGDGGPDVAPLEVNPEPVQPKFQ